MTRRLARKPRAACRLPGVVDACLAFGHEAACPLCDMVDMDHPVTCRTTGRYPAMDPVATTEDLFWAHLARRTDGGPRTPAQLAKAPDRRYKYEQNFTPRTVAPGRTLPAPLPIDPPF